MALRNLKFLIIFCRQPLFITDDFCLFDLPFYLVSSSCYIVSSIVSYKSISPHRLSVIDVELLSSLVPSASVAGAKSVVPKFVSTACFFEEVLSK